MRRLLRRLGLILLTAALTAMVGYRLMFPQLSRCHTVDWSDFRPLTDKLYASAAADGVRIDSLNRLLDSARARNARFWGGITADPVIIYCTTDDEFRRYGIGKSLAVAMVSPFGTYIVIGPGGFNLDIISHEFCHAEFAARVGHFTRRRKIPTWFDEGLAMMLDYRFVDPRQMQPYVGYIAQWHNCYARGLADNDLDKLDTYEEFFADDADPDRINCAYMTAAMEVARWLQAVGQEGLLEFADGIRTRDDFSAYYQQIETNAETESPKSQ